MTNGNDARPSVLKLILVPALITLGVTLVRLAGELWGGPSALFNKAAGGAGALIGIVWLIPIFGFYFGRRLARSGSKPAGLGRVFGFMAAAILVFAAFVAGAFQFPAGSLPWVLGLVAGPWLAVAVAHRGWPDLGTALIAYGLAARIPVAILMLFAILGNWGTHYDVPPPNFPEMAPFARWVAIGLMPQLTLWIAATVILGLLGGALALAVAGPAGRTVPSTR
jgi:hypothetical protein